LSELRRELIAAENDIYRIFNELNLDDEYDIICREEARARSQFRHRVCKARLYWEAVEQSAEKFAEDEGNWSSGLDDEYHSGVLRLKMRDLAAAHPDLRAALERHRDLQRAYDAARERSEE
jgi:hypothetical protein